MSMEPEDDIAARKPAESAVTPGGRGWSVPSQAPISTGARRPPDASASNVVSAIPSGSRISSRN